MLTYVNRSMDIIVRTITSIWAHARPTLSGLGAGRGVPCRQNRQLSPPLLTAPSVQYGRWLSGGRHLLFSIKRHAVRTTSAFFYFRLFKKEHNHCNIVYC